MLKGISRNAIAGSLAGASLAWAGLAQATTEKLTVQLSGANEVPAEKTPGTGTATITFDSASRIITWSVTYKGLSGPLTMAHFHGPAAAGQNGPVAVWLTKQMGGVANPIVGQATLTADQAKQFQSGQWYVNLHTQTHPSGEIRAQILPPKS